MRKKISINENGLSVLFQIRDNGVVELCDFSAAGVEKQSEKMQGNPEIYHPVVEVQITGKTTRGMHGYKHNVSSASLDFTYTGHDFIKHEDGKELVISLQTTYGVTADYHMRLFDQIPVVQTWTVLENKGEEAIGLEYVSSFIYQGIASNGNQPYYDKTELYIPFNSWSNEAQWQKVDAANLNLNGMPVDGFNTPGAGINRYCYTGNGSWSSCEYLPMGYATDLETEETYCFQVEHSGQWHIEYGSETGKHLYLALSGAAEYEHGWWKNLKPGDCFETVPAAFGVARGSIDEAAAAMTAYRRQIRRPNQDDEKLNVVFNDYMNCLMGDPTDEKERQIIDKAAEMGCEYYCLDCGWYDKDYWWDRVGAWIESPERFPHGLKAICDYTKSKGMKMGLWLEIEVMGIACELAAKLPDNWFICRHGKRHEDNKRYLLDFRNPEVRKYCRDVIDRLIHDYGVEYFKVDYNVTQGYGSDLNSDSCSDAIREHYLCLYQWYTEIFQEYPDLVIENCGSGGMRMDYGMLKLLSLQSTSDQTDYIYNSHIAANVASAVTPEQAGMWVYPYEDDAEHVIYNMVNGLLLRPYLSGMVWKLSDESIRLMQEGVALYKTIRNDIKEGYPVFPLGFGTIQDEVLVYGIHRADVLYLAVFTPKTDRAEIPLEGNIEQISVIYPRKENCSYCFREGKLLVDMPQKKAARLFKITFKYSEIK
ncbi:MAG: alpha-galactosidase [Lachnospiraceae bacterium]|nr:alpha-galactosidase [Lachnospiraceae bacterium]